MREDIVESGLVWVIVGFGILISLNLLTLAIGPSGILQNLNSRSWGVLVSVFVFDSWGTAGGLAGVVVLFAPLLFGIPRPKRFRMSIFFLCASIGTGIIANVIWSFFYNRGGLIGSGSSSIAISGQGVIFAISIFGLINLWLTREMDGAKLADVQTREWRQFFLIVYLTLIVSTLYFVIILEPIYIPTELYNWRVHEFGFFIAIAATAVFIYVNTRASSVD